MYTLSLKSSNSGQSIHNVFLHEIFAQARRDTEENTNERKHTLCACVLAQRFLDGYVPTRPNHSFASVHSALFISLC